MQAASCVMKDTELEKLCRIARSFAASLSPQAVLQPLGGCLCRRLPPPEQPRLYSPPDAVPVARSGP